MKKQKEKQCKRKEVSTMVFKTDLVTMIILSLFVCHVAHTIDVKWPAAEEEQQERECVLHFVCDSESLSESNKEATIIIQPKEVFLKPKNKAHHWLCFLFRCCAVLLLVSAVVSCTFNGHTLEGKQAHSIRQFVFDNDVIRELRTSREESSDAIPSLTAQIDVE